VKMSEPTSHPSKPWNKTQCLRCKRHVNKTSMSYGGSVRAFKCARCCRIVREERNK